MISSGSTSDGWIEADLWAVVERQVPILCVDLLPWWRDGDGQVSGLLIERLDAAPDADEIGFGQGYVMNALAKRVAES